MGVFEGRGADSPLHTMCEDEFIFREEKGVSSVSLDPSPPSIPEKLLMRPLKFL